MKAATIQARQWRVVELAFTAQQWQLAAAVELTADFTGPRGQHYRLRGFWDGGACWKIRFTPPTPGRWIYVTSCNRKQDSGLHGRTGALSAHPAQGGNPLYRHGGFLRVSANRHYLTHTDGTPFFWLGDTWWFCPSDLMPFDSAYKPLIARRKRQGFSVVQMAFLGRLTAGGRRSGISGEFSQLFSGQINPHYWRMVDRYLFHANQAGILPVIGMGFHKGLNAPPLAALKRLWSYVLARYGALSVSWLICGEYNSIERDAQGQPISPRTDAARARKILELGQFIKDNDPYSRAMTVHPWWYKDEKRQAWTRPWHDFSMIQGGHEEQGPPPASYLEIYRRAGKPFLEGECTYEGIRGFAAAVIRQNAYKAMQCGSAGFTYGSHGLWYPNQNARDKTFKEWGPPIPWRDAARRPGADQMTRLRACYETAPWYRLKPVAAETLLARDPVDSAATLPALATASADDYYLIFFPARSPEAPALRLTFIGGAPGKRYALAWFNPRTGRTTKAGPTLIGGRNDLLPGVPDAQDWLLKIRVLKNYGGGNSGRSGGN